MKLEKPLSPEQRRADLIAGYLEKYACIDGRTVTTQMYETYIEALDDLDMGQLEKGLKAYLREGTRWPWPGTLREFIEEEV